MKTLLGKQYGRSGFLKFTQLLVKAVSLHQILMGAALYNMTILNYNNFIGMLNGAKPVCNYH